MKRIKTSCAIAACLGLVACGDGAKSGTKDSPGNGSGATAGAPTGGQNNTDIKPGDFVDLDGDGTKDDGVAIDENMDGVADGVDTNGDGKVDKPLPGGSDGGTTGGGTTGGGTTGGTPAPTCDGVGVCDDNFSDTCDADPDSCPTTQASGIDEPSWDCAGTPPANVYAYATFPDGTSVKGVNLAKGACVVFFEGAKDLFYAKWFRFAPANVTDACSKYEGCICPKGTFLNQSFDRRLYAFTWDGDAACDEILIIDHKDGDPETTLNQPVSNDCRKYLYALHSEGDNGTWAPNDGQGAYELPFSYVAGSLGDLKLRLETFPKVEVACVAVQTGGSLPWAQLMVSDVQLNKSYVAKK